MIDSALILQLFVLINPLSSLPFLVAAHGKGIDVRKLSLSAIVTAFSIAVAIALVGPYLFSIFGITLNSFRIAGGVILFLLALDTIRTHKEKSELSPGSLDSLVAILATPLLTGPATISFITIKAYDMSVLPLICNISIAFFFVGVIFVIFSFSIAKINVRLIDIVSKILGLFLTAMAIEMIVFGMKGMMSAK
ncbi:MAG: MarC family protein [Candidatus Brocadiae bacterium]|nr:MarC family protein [Candidatus Brocadiia bacterium]